METGFYHVAVNAGVPIALAYMDYKNKKLALVKLFIRQGILKKIWLRSWLFMPNINAKFPEKFSVDTRYHP